jgi:peroxiredoxin
LGITFPLLSDEGSKTIDAYGVRNHEATSERVRGIPHPTIFILDAGGVIRARLAYEGYKKRPTGDAVIQAASAIR